MRAVQSYCNDYMNIVKRFLNWFFQTSKFYRALRDYASAVIAAITAGYLVLWRTLLTGNIIIGLVFVLFLFALTYAMYANFYNRFDRVVNKKLKANTNNIYLINRGARLFKAYFIAVELGIISAGFLAFNESNSITSIVISSGFAAIFALIGFFAIYLTSLILDEIHKRRMECIKPTKRS